MGDKLLQELPAYLSAAKGFTVDHHDTKAFTEGVLGWWASNGTKFPTWAEAARTVFSFTPNSAAAERVFSLLKRHRRRRARRRPQCITERLQQIVRRRLRLFLGRTVRSER